LIVTGVQTCALPISPQLSTHPLDGFVTHCRQEVDKEFANLTFRKARTKRIPQEVEPLVGIGSSAIRVLAVHDARLVWMQLQSTRSEERRVGKGCGAR